MKHQRSADRDSLLLLAVMRLADQAETQRIKVRNLSNSGMMAEAASGIVCNGRLVVDLRNIGWVSGTVAWVSANRFGVVFDREIDCKAVRRPVIADQQAVGAPVPRPRVLVNVPAAIEPANLRRI